MRVLHIYSGNLSGGVETVLAAIARHRELSPDLEHDFALCFDGRCAADLRTAGAPVHLLGMVRTSRPLSVLRARTQLRELLRRGNYDAAICHSCWPHAIFAPVVRSAGIPLVFWQHDVLSGRHWSERWASLTKPDLIFSNSKFSSGSLATVFPHTPGRIIYYPVMNVPPRPPSARMAIRKQLETADEDVVILQVSRIEEYKGHRLNFEALRRIKNEPRCVLWVAGGPQRPLEFRLYESLRALGASTEIADRVRFLGWRQDVADLLAAADIHCQPNTGPEPFGITFIEAMQAGVPVVTTALGAAPEIIDESCGILTPPGDAAALAEAWKRLRDEPELRIRLGTRGRERAYRLCDPAKQMAQIQTELSGLTSATRSRAA